ncbi:MAG: anthranilate synthase component I [Phycisphaerales bacterium]|nr:anthranilate synthase component I [Phycisphaerales bacterium]
MHPSFDEFSTLARSSNRVPVTATVIADDLTPVSAFARLAADAPRAFLFESVVGGEHVARYSFLGLDPTWTFEFANGRGVLTNHAQSAMREFDGGDPLAALDGELRGMRCAGLPGLPHFLGGAVGYAAYDTVRYYERLPNAPRDDRGLPDLAFDFYETIALFDHVNKTTTLVKLAAIPVGADTATLRGAYDSAYRTVDRMLAKLQSASKLRPMRIVSATPGAERCTSNTTREQFERMVLRAQAYIAAGDIFQVVLSQRMLFDTQAEPFDVYRALRVINPSPFMFYLKTPRMTLVGASPEILCRVENGLITNRPLAGTRPRGRTPDEDQQLSRELLADPKERAEHIMLVDLGRNDVGRVAEAGSVRLEDVMSIERYSHVMHISSTVTGKLRQGLSALDALRATLPVGTVSGAPKVRAMEIIDECEQTRRGPYGGAVGYLDLNGNMDMCIALRTLVFTPAASGYHAYAQVGAGVVADSNPTSEYQETLNKAGSMLAAIALAESNL